MPLDAFIVGIGETRHAPQRDDVNTTEIAWEAVRAAIEDAGVELNEIEAAITASQDFWEGRTISSMAVNEIAGATFKAESKTASDGTLALVYAATRIAVGFDTLMIVLAHCKESQADAHTVEMSAFDPYVQRLLDPDETVLAGMQAQLLDISLDDRARVVAAARRRSPILEPLDAASVASSPETSAPLRQLERAPLMDGAVALVICNAAHAKRLGRPAVRVAGASTATDSYWSDRDLRSAGTVQPAVAAALADAGWADLPDRVELSAPYAHQALLWGRALGASGPAAFEDGGLCATGGWLGGRPGVVTGLSAVAQCARELREGSVADGRAIAHGTTGLLGQSHHFVCVEAAG